MKTSFRVWFKFADNGRYTEHGIHDTLEQAMASTHLGDPAEAYTDISAWTQPASGDTIFLAERITNEMGRSSPWLISKIQVPENDGERIDLAVSVAMEFSSYDGDHHKMWVIDQMLRHLLGDKYDETIARYNGADDDDEDDWERPVWDVGVAP